MGFLCKVVIIVDILLAFNQLSQLDNDTEQFSVEVQKSRSTIQAVKSGLSLPLVHNFNPLSCSGPKYLLIRNRRNSYIALWLLMLSHHYYNSPPPPPPPTECVQ